MATLGRRDQRHRQEGGHVLLFVRPSRKDERGETCPYTCLGLADYVSHTGARPLAITWRLRLPIPAAFYREAALKIA
ncbi:MAG: hypothetical protein RBU45_26785 [Myxococcota bacterium]|nr:hypothetical protein [Myxococcota bacterium]